MCRRKFHGNAPSHTPISELPWAKKTKFQQSHSQPTFTKLLNALHGHISMRGNALNKQLLWSEQAYYDTSEISSIFGSSFFAGNNINHGYWSPEFQGLTVQNPSDDFRNYLKANASIVMPKYNWTLCFWWKFGMLTDVEGTIISIKTTGSSMWCCILFYLIKNGSRSHMNKQSFDSFILCHAWLEQNSKLSLS